MFWTVNLLSLCVSVTENTNLCSVAADTIRKEGLGCHSKDERYICGTAEEKASR